LKKRELTKIGGYFRFQRIGFGKSSDPFDRIRYSSRTLSYLNAALSLTRKDNVRPNPTFVLLCSRAIQTYETCQAISSVTRVNRDDGQNVIRQFRLGDPN